MIRLIIVAAMYCGPSATVGIAQDSLPANSETATTQASQASQATDLKPLTLEAIYGPEGKVDFDGKSMPSLRWLPGKAAYLREIDDVALQIDPRTGESKPFVDATVLANKLRATGHFDETAAKRAAGRIGDWCRDYSTRIIRNDRGVFAFRRATGDMRVSKPIPEGSKAIEISPRGDHLSFVLKNDLYALNTQTGKTTRLTRDGTDTLFNGVLDWVYQEELYGRGNWTGHWWSDDESHIAYLQLDESRVPTYTTYNLAKPRPEGETFNYPKAGEPNPTVRLGIVRVRDARTTWADLSRYSGKEVLIVRVGWSPKGDAVALIQDREQRWMDLCVISPDSGALRVLLRETSPAWVENMNLPKWLSDGSFLWLSDATGHRHLHHRAASGGLIRRLTSGEWSVKTLHGYDAATKFVYFSAEKDSALEMQAYRVPLGGGEIVRLTDPGATHRAVFSGDFAFFTDTHSSALRPPRMELRRSDGELVCTIEENPDRTLMLYEISEPEFFRVPTRDGWLLNAMLLRPANFDPGRRYPVLCKVYAGPDAPTVDNEWNARAMPLDQYQAQQGFLIWRIDPRSAAGDSPRSAWTAYQRLGEVELRDIEDSIRWLIDQGWADGERVGIMGHSYGGFMAAYALTHSKMFKIGIAGAPVTDWSNYDTIYTERYMRTPQNNPDGYEATSVWRKAKDLSGRLLLAHGMVDDNVHVQNSIELIAELQKHARPFELMIFPHDAHGFRRGEKLWRAMQWEFIRERL
ncbi:MAG: S9 family peptidase [Phycisphaerae bacterium]